MQLEYCGSHLSGIITGIFAHYLSYPQIPRDDCCTRRDRVCLVIFAVPCSNKSAGIIKPDQNDLDSH